MKTINFIKRMLLNLDLISTRLCWWIVFISFCILLSIPIIPTLILIRTLLIFLIIVWVSLGYYTVVDEKLKKQKDKIRKRIKELK